MRTYRNRNIRIPAVVVEVSLLGTPVYIKRTILLHYSADAALTRIRQVRVIYLGSFKEKIRGQYFRISGKDWIILAGFCHAVGSIVIDIREFT